jgi:thioredoxin reductase (NADPH)
MGMSDTAIIWIVALLLGAATVVPAIVRIRRRERRGRSAREEALTYGLHEPVSLHPVVDPAACMGSGSCVTVCPEQVLALVDGQAAAVAAARCVGHGLCERACPVEAIRLVFGTATRGIDLPRVRENFETSVPGVYIVGELGGMGLVRNAFEQGRQCVEGIAREPRRQSAPLDAVVVGCGPAGLSTAIHLQRRGLRFVVLEKERETGGAVRHYPRRKLVMTRPLEIPGWGTLRGGTVPKERLIDVWDEVAARLSLPVVTDALVERVEPGPDGFAVHAGGRTYTGHRVILAIGRRGVPRKLGVPGEDEGSVYYALAEPESFAGRAVTVVGGGDSAVEAALMLAATPDTTVRLSYRGAQLTRVRPANLDRFRAAVAEGSLQPLWGSTVRQIGEDRLTCALGDGSTVTYPNDDTFVFIGGELPTRFLRETGVAVETKFGQP